MAKIINLGQAKALPRNSQFGRWAYNAIDAMGTREIADTLLARMDPVAAKTYQFELAAQSPAMAMSLRGIKIDLDARDDAMGELKKEYKSLLRSIQHDPIVIANWDQVEKVTGACPHPSRKDGKHKWERGVPDSPARHCVDCGTSRYKLAPFNPGSPDQCYHLFYETLKVKRQFNKTGQVSTDEEALARIGKGNKKLQPLTTQIISLRGIKKQIGFMKTKLTPDGRFPSIFNVGAAWTGRWSSSSDPFGYGGNSQNIAERHRRIFTADTGKVLFYADLKQAESNIVAHLAGDEEYIEAHRSGDVHTYVTRLVWPEYDWTGDIFADAKIAKGILPEWDQAPGHDIRFQSKRIQHGSNYGLSPFGIAMIAHIPVEAARNSQRRYFQAFPGIRDWQRKIRVSVELNEPLVSPLGVRTRLFGRPWDEHTYKQGLSLLPQGTVAHIINLAAWNVWTHMDPELLELLAQIHDALLGQFPEDTAEETARKLAHYMTIPIPVVDINGKTRITTIEAEVAVGKNWGHYHPEKNPLGVKEIHI